MADIFHLFNIKTGNPSTVYKALTEEEGLSSWWTTGAKAKPEEGTTAYFTFTRDYTKQMKVLSLEENKKVEWECVGGDEQWIGTKITFEIEHKENSVDVRFKHKGWKEETDLFGSCNYHWGLYMKSLKSYIETGTGNPHQPNFK